MKYAPWNAAEVRSLREYQKDPNHHPFTCPKSGHGALIANTSGWTCAKCDYTQNWAHSFMLEFEKEPLVSKNGMYARLFLDPYTNELLAVPYERLPSDDLPWEHQEVVIMDKAEFEKLVEEIKANKNKYTVSRRGVYDPLPDHLVPGHNND